jgi:hypothetical protein
VECTKDFLTKALALLARAFVFLRVSSRLEKQEN